MRSPSQVPHAAVFITLKPVKLRINLCMAVMGFVGLDLRREAKPASEILSSKKHVEGDSLVNTESLKTQ
jgi:hypothetical protein